MRIVPIVLSGGSGKRLWPMSRAAYPKQFVNGLNGKAQSPLTATLSRLAPGHEISAPTIVCNAAHRFLVREHADAAGVSPDAIVLEPVARNTAPATTVAALLASRADPASTLVVMPSDHSIEDTAGFSAAIRRAAEIAADGRIVLFGMPPSAPHTGFGYILKGPPLAAPDSAFAVDRFIEKPDEATAATLLADGRYLWNSGIFVVRADAFLSEMALRDPGLLARATDALDRATADLGFVWLDGAAFAGAPNISVDRCIMEHTSRAAVMPLDVGWTDLGSWDSLWTAAPRDTNGNFVQGDALTHDAADCYISSEKALVAAIGVSNLVIVETKDTVLVADKSRSQEVATLVARMQAAKRTEPEQHLRRYRPWGFCELLNAGARFQVKLLHVNPGGALSLQMHHHRSEHWVVVQGTARVVVDDCERFVRENESIYIVATQWHRLENPGKVPLELIEVQIGSYLGDDDIVRADDMYHRAGGEAL